MKLIILVIFFYINIFSSNVSAKNIVVVNLQSLIDNNQNYIQIINSLEISQEKYLTIYKNTEDELKIMLNEIETSKLILNEDEINILIDDYNNKLNKFSIEVEEFNLHYQEQIIKIRETVLNEIIILLEDYAKKYDIDLILDSTSYLIASNSINITKDIQDQLNEINFDLGYKNFEKN